MESNERLVLELSGGGPPAELPQSGVLVVGSSRDKAGFLVEGQGVAGVHCAIGRASGGGWAIKDLGSDFGTYVNGKKVQAARLAEGDQILLGSRRLRVSRPGAERPAEPAPSAAPNPTPRAEPKPAPPPPRSASPPPRVPEPPAEALSRSQIAPPPRIGGYRIERLLGRGAQGNVYLAVQESLARQVALKVLSAAVERDSEFVRRFQAEARAAAALNHPNVVTVYDVGEADGHHYLSMEYMDKSSLEERVSNEGPLSWRIVLDALVDAAAGLMFAESRGIVHRDIKPANLMQNAAGATKIADLGLAAHADAEAEEEVEGGRKIFGTPHFIAPEQVRGERADARSDLYSLGATAYRLLTGRTPFEGQNSREILRAVLREEPKPIGECVPGVPPELAALVMRLMDKDPAARFPSAGALSAELVALQRRDQGLAAVGGSLEHERRSRLPLILGLVGAGAAVTALALALRGGKAEGPAPPPRPPDVRPADAPAPPSLDAPLVVEPGPAPTPVDDDTQLKLLETEAELELLRIAQASLTEPERLVRLRELAQKYAGTTPATTALEQSERIAAELARDAAAGAARESALEAFVTRLRAAANLERRPLDVGEALRAVRALDPPPELEGDEVLPRRRAALLAEILAVGNQETAAALASADGLVARGEFEAARSELDAARRRLDLPAFDADSIPEGLPRLLELRGQVRRRLEEFDQVRAQALAQLGRDDAGRISSALRGAAGLEGRLARLELGAAAAELAALEGRLATTEAKAYLAALRADVEAAERALRTLHGSFDQWRRLLVPDPRDRRGGTREARGADAEGLLVDGGERLPWTAFAGKPRELHALFHERLSRAWTAEEQAGISSLLRLMAVVEVLRVAGPAFRAEEAANLSERQARELPEPFGPARDWAPTPEARTAVERERQASELLAEGLRQGALGAWSRAVVALERLIDGHDDSLLVRLLSDGRALAPPPVAAEEAGLEVRLPDEPAAPRPPTPAGEDGGDDDATDGDGERQSRRTPRGSDSARGPR